MQDRVDAEEGLVAVTYADLDAGENVWGPKIESQLRTWMQQNPPPAEQIHVNGRDPDTKKRLSEEEKAKVRQRFRGDWSGVSRKERRRQQKAVKASTGGQADPAP
jgi:tRNA pseudouridine55 synthase